MTRRPRARDTDSTGRTRLTSDLRSITAQSVAIAPLPRRETTWGSGIDQHLEPGPSRGTPTASAAEWTSLPRCEQPHPAQRPTRAMSSPASLLARRITYRVLGITRIPNARAAHMSNASRESRRTGRLSDQFTAHDCGGRLLRAARQDRDSESADDRRGSSSRAIGRGFVRLSNSANPSRRYTDSRRSPTSAHVSRRRIEIPGLPTAQVWCGRRRIAKVKPNRRCFAPTTFDQTVAARVPATCRTFSAHRIGHEERINPLQSEIAARLPTLPRNRPI